MMSKDETFSIIKIMNDSLSVESLVFKEFGDGIISPIELLENTGIKIIYLSVLFRLIMLFLDFC
jgi:hypothetical protein